MPLYFWACTGMPGTETIHKLTCYHCGDSCPDTTFQLDDKYFCCFGCKTVYEILSRNDLCDYYAISDHPGVTQRGKAAVQKYTVLDIPTVREKYVHFAEGDTAYAQFHLPAMHCSSCIWLLEHMHTLHPGILQARVDFPKKEIRIAFDITQVQLSDVGALLDAIGYEPYLRLDDTPQNPDKSQQRKTLIKIGIAGFAFGNCMMLAFPEYLAGGDISDPHLQSLFRILSLVLALPVFIYSANAFYIPAWKGLKKGYLNIDVPLALAIILTFGRSLYAIFIEHTAGYFDSMTGLVFFMLLGRYFQDLTYKTISFDRDYRSYFPLAVSRIEAGKEMQVPLSDVQKGDMLLVRDGELIPADALLVKGKGYIDYSFVTGESEPVEKKIGELLYAGGRQVGSTLEVSVLKEVSQSYLTQLWNNIDTGKKQEEHNSLLQLTGKYFALAVLLISCAAFAFWMIQGETQTALDALITPLIVACPCALLLSATFTNGNALRYLSRIGIFLKNAFVLERITQVDTVVFDKTGTLTQANTSSTHFTGDSLQPYEKDLIAALAMQSNHPYSKAIVQWIGEHVPLAVEKYQAIAGAGIEGMVEDIWIRIGSAEFIGAVRDDISERGRSYVSIAGKVRGIFHFNNAFRPGLEALMEQLRNDKQLYILSGDNNSDRSYFARYFAQQNMFFEQSPHDKLKNIKYLQQRHHVVMMLGDGLNDAGALQQSDVGIAVTQSTHFTPASDVVMDVGRLPDLNALFRFAKAGRRIIVASFVISILYNTTGLFFALQGALSPVLAAILMPLSTISIVSFTTGMTTLAARRLFARQHMRE
ncbi:MAG: heavy metal translocating P-type ATPase [Chitinophagales bacterium]